MRHSAAGVTTEAFPTTSGRRRASTRSPTTSSRDRPGRRHPDPALAQLNQIPALRMEWLVPGLLKEKLVQLVKTLPRRSAPSWCRCRNSSTEFIAAVGGDGRRWARA